VHVHTRVCGHVCVQLVGLEVRVSIINLLTDPMVPEEAESKIQASTRRSERLLE